MCRPRGGHAGPPLLDECGLDDEAARCVSDEIKRVTRDERQRRLTHRIEDLHIVWIDDERLADSVMVDAVARGERERVADAHAAKRAEDRVAMTGDADVA